MGHAFNAYDQLQEVVHAITNVHFPNVHAIAKKIATNDPARQEQLIEAAAKRRCSSWAHRHVLL